MLNLQGLVRTVLRNSDIGRSCFRLEEYAAPGATAFARTFAKGSDTIPNTNVKVDTPPPPSQSEYAFSGGKGLDDETEKGARPSFDSKPVGPDTQDIGGAATIPSTNVDVKAGAPDAASAFDEEHGSTRKVISAQGSAVSLEEEDGSHHSENRDMHYPSKDEASEGKIDQPGIHTGP